MSKVDGRALARKIYSTEEKNIEDLKKREIVPHLLVILIGNDPGSKAYIRQKMKRGEELGVRVTLKRFPIHTSQKTVLTFIAASNKDRNIHGIIIQRPLPNQFEIDTINKAVLPEKDVDGFHPDSAYEPPLALAVMRILEEIQEKETKKSFKEWLTSQNIVFIGRGEAGGRPVISHTEKLGVKHSVIHSKTENPEEIMRNADIIISAVGKERIIQKDFLKKGVILIGIGLHKNDEGKLSGDYNQEEIKEVASYYTPTPGGVGPVNVAMLLQNLVDSAMRT